MIVPQQTALSLDDAVSRPARHRAGAPIVLHFRTAALRFRILSTGPVPSTESPPCFPVPFSSAHRMCRKAKDCYGDETPHRHQR